MTLRTIQLPERTIAPEHLAFFRWGRVGDKVVLTTDAGQWHLLSPEDFDALLAGPLDESHPELAALQAKGFLRQGLDLEDEAARLRRKKRYLQHGPHLHIVLSTLRCNQGCRYCHASRVDMSRTDKDMSAQTARRVVDLALQTTSPTVNFEFQGGEPTVNMDALRFLVDYAHERNRDEGKDLTFSVVSNFTNMDEDKAEWLLANDVMLCTSLDGPPALHDWNRPWSGGAAQERVVHWIKWFNQRYIEMGRDPRTWHVDALMTTTRRTLEQGEAVLDLYESLGIRSVHLRPLNPYGFARKTWETIGYTTAEYLAFYERMLDEIIARNLDGRELIEGTAAVFLKKMLTPDDPNYVDLRSPCGAGTGQVAYDTDGQVYTCDEARMVAAEGDQRFSLGHVDELDYQGIVTHETVRAIAAASTTDSLPGCATCWNKPFCGVCPLHNHAVFGTLFGQRPTSPKCQENYRVAELLLQHLANDPDGRIDTIFRRWTVSRPRTETCAV